MTDQTNVVPLTDKPLAKPNPIIVSREGVSDMKSKALDGVRDADGEIKSIDGEIATLQEQREQQVLRRDQLRALSKLCTEFIGGIDDIVPEPVKSHAPKRARKGARK